MRDYILAIIGISGGLYGFIQFIISRNDNTKKALMCLLGFEIRNACTRAIEKGSISCNELSQLQEMNDIYHALNGNGYIRVLMDRVNHLQIVDE